MRKTPIDREIEAMLESAAGDVAPPDYASTKSSVKGWYPDLNPTQRLIFEDPTRFLLGYGEKGSGKSIGFGHKIVRHCYEAENGLGMIIAPSIRTGGEGIWHDLETLILPQWNEGMGLETTGSKLDPNTKDRTMWIGNRFGGWSKLLLISIPYAVQVEDRIKGPAPSHVYAEELTNCDGPEYFRFPAAQLNRRRGISGPQQYCASCNPKGPKHWVYDVFFRAPVNEETGERDKDFAVYHVPITENLHRLPPGYIQSLEKIFATDPIEKRRLINGEWIERPSGLAIFKDTFERARHVKGDAQKNIGILPIAGIPIFVGYDPGPVNFSVHFIQFVPVRDRVITLVFDELNFVGRRTPYHVVVPTIMRWMQYWQGRMDHIFSWQHISDEAAFNQVRSDGSFDHAEIEKLSVEFLEEHPLYNATLKRIKLKPCPKGKDSVPARVMMVQQQLARDQLFISATCTQTLDMFEQLESEKEKPMYDPLLAFRPARSQYIHPFDSMSYPMFYISTGGRIVEQKPVITPMVYACGSA